MFQKSSPEKLDSHHSATKHRLEQRKQLVRKTCSDSNIPQSFDKINLPDKPLLEGKLFYCPMEKVGSTFLKAITKQYKSSGDIHEKHSSKVKTILVVRDPYGRLMSGYVDKLLTHYWWWSTNYNKRFGGYVIRKFRDNPTEDDIRCGSDVTFTEFLKYWVHAQETGVRKDPHFKPMHENCRICGFEYDYIVHLETIKDDLSYIFQEVGTKFHNPYISQTEVALDDKLDLIYTMDPWKFIKPNCVSNCTLFNRVWTNFQFRGIISKDFQQPFKGGDCFNVTREKFSQILYSANKQSNGINRKKQKRQMMAALYMQAPLALRQKVRQFLMPDLTLHGYETSPADIFPELTKQKSRT